MKPTRAPDATTPEGLTRHLDEVNKVLSNISFGTTIPTTTPPAGQSAPIVEREANMDGNKFQVSFPAAPNTDITIQHNLGRVPTGWLVLRSVNQGFIYIGSVGPTKTTITLRETQGSQQAILHFL